MAPSDKCGYFEDFVPKIFCMQILVVFGLQREFSLQVGRAPRFTIALSPERHLTTRFLRRLFRTYINKDDQVIAPECTLDRVCRVQHPSTNFFNNEEKPPSETAHVYIR
jgi:hypothetical protein